VSGNLPAGEKPGAFDEKHGVPAGKKPNNKKARAHTAGLFW